MSFPANIDLFALDGTNGFRFRSFGDHDHVGRSVASAGDVNGDGFADVIIGAGSTTGTPAVTSYVVFGAAAGFDYYVDASSLDGTNGFKLSDRTVADFRLASVASAGDVNGDGFADLIIGAFSNRIEVTLPTVASYVVFGKAIGFAAELDLSGLDGTDGFRLGGATSEGSGYSVASAGDVNSDGFADLIVGAPLVRSPLFGAAGASYLVFGKASGFAASLELSSLNGINGSRLVGGSHDDIRGWSDDETSGWSVASAGDVNSDGFADVVIGAPNAYHDAGNAYVVFGASGFVATGSLADLDGHNGFPMRGASTTFSGWSVA